MSRGDLTNEQWERLRALLPPQRARCGRPPKDHRPIVNGLLWLARTGAPWRDLPGQYGPWQTVATRFYRWRRAGIWDRILADLQQQADAEGELDWSLHHVDGTMIRAHQHAAGAQKRGLTTCGIPTRRWAGARVALAPKSTCAPKGEASRWSCCLRRDNATSRRCSSR